MFSFMFSSTLLMSVVFACRACDVHTSVFYMSRCGWVGGRPTNFVCQLFPPNLRCFPPLGAYGCVCFSNVTCLEGCLLFRCDVSLKDVSRFVIRIDIIPCSPEVKKLSEFNLFREDVCELAMRPP